MKAVRDFALGFHAGNHRMKRGEKAALLEALAAVRKETVDARDFLTKVWPFPPKPQFDLLLSHFARPDAALARSATPSEVR